MQQTAREPKRLSIQDLSARTGMSIRNIQKYIGIGLLRPPVGKTRMAYYVQAHMDELNEVRYLMAKEGSLARVSELMSEKRRKAAEEAAGRPADAPVADGSSLLSNMNIVEDMLLAVSRNLTMSEPIQQALVNDIRKAFDRARLEAVGAAHGASHGRLPEHRIRPTDVSIGAVA